jgi:hypothetical protein
MAMSVDLHQADKSQKRAALAIRIKAASKYKSRIAGVPLT